MTPEQRNDFLSRIVDGQEFSVTTVKGNDFRGIFNGDLTDLIYLGWDDLRTGNARKCKWENVQTAAPLASARTIVAGDFVVPPEHPLSGADSPGGAWTTRQRPDD